LLIVSFIRENLNYKGFALNSDFLGKLVSQPHAPQGDETEMATGWVPVNQIQKGRFQPRQFFSPESIDTLAQSFRKQGFRGAINVRPLPDGTYELVVGERRWLAAKQAGLEKIRAIIDHYSDSDVAPSQELKRIEELLSYFDIELQTFRTKNLHTLSLPKELKQGHLEQHLPYSCALELSKIKDEKTRKALLAETVKNKLSFRDIKERVQNLAGKGRGEKDKKESHPLIKRFEATVTRFKTTAHFFEQEQKKKRLELLLNKLEALLKDKN
jgi:ParB family transcriptional regulator, chromosome partitioning protein